MSDDLRAHRAALHENHSRMDQLRRTYAEIADREFYSVFMAKAVEGFDAAVHHVRETFGPREREAVKRTHEEIEAAEGPSIKVSSGRGSVRRILRRRL
jgi:hypothetical protein